MSDSHIDEEVFTFVNDLHAVLAGHDPDLQGFVLAEALATFVAGHIIPDDPAETRAMRAAVLRQHVEMVRKMIPARVVHIHGDEARLRPN